HNLAWSFDSGSQAFNFLGRSESLQLTYTVQATDGLATSNQQTVTITITGSNDAPVISVVNDATPDTVSATKAETNAGLTAAGTLTVRDADLTDTVTASVVTGVTLTGTTGGLTSADVQSMLSVTASAINAAPPDTHNLAWSFNSGS